MAKRIIIQQLAFLGQSATPAIINFGKQSTVICGSSDTGKSFITDTINFLLGSSKALRDIPERVPYDRCQLSFYFPDTEERATVERALSGGAFRLFDSAESSQANPSEFRSLAPKHKEGSTDNLSGWLLSHLGLMNKRVKKNKEGQTNSLSFRYIAPHVLVDEEAIIGQRSPFLSGQVIFTTVEYSVLKLLLTGSDDSAIHSIETPATTDQPAEKQLGALVAIVEELESEISDIPEDEEELVDQLARLEASTDAVLASLANTRASSHEALKLRRQLVETQTHAQDRADEIGELLARFDILGEHYKSDTERLEAVKEAGSMYAYLPPRSCPLCGAAPEHQAHGEGCDADVAAVIAAATAELEKVAVLGRELVDTRVDLEGERSALIETISTLGDEISAAGRVIDEVLAPQLDDIAEQVRVISEKKYQVQAKLNVYDRLARYVERRDGLLSSHTDVSSGDDTAGPTLSKATLGELSRYVRDTLQEWNFPDSDEVYFDEKEKDFVIGNKPRASFGKGYRAITHAAAKLSLMRYCHDHSLPHPGFVVLDSPLLSYWQPEGPGDSLEGTDLKENFYDYLSSDAVGGQVIVIENQHEGLVGNDNLEVIVFTRNPDEGRFGLFPIA